MLKPLRQAGDTMLQWSFLLGLTASRPGVRDRPLEERIDALLPQTQCGQCDYPGCLPYARAIASGEAEINQCPPGGERTIRRIARLLGRKPVPLNPAHDDGKASTTVVRIDEEQCIGCALCLKACPVDAIVGAPRLMHTVIRDECTGCDLCIEPCPVDCIHVETTGEPAAPVSPLAAPIREVLAEAERLRRADRARLRFRRRNERITRREQEREQRRREKKAARTVLRKEALPEPGSDHASKQAVIQAAVARVRARRARRDGTVYDGSGRSDPRNGT